MNILFQNFSIKRILWVPLLFLLAGSSYSQVNYGQKQLATRENQAVLDTVSGITLIINLASPVAQNGQVSTTLIQSGNNNTPAVYEIEYLPDAGFTGVDTFTLELQYISAFPYLSYQSYRVEVRESLIRTSEDYATIEAGQTDTLDVLANDSGSNPPYSIEIIPLSNHLNLSIVGDEIQVSPEAGFTGIAHFNYTVCDALENCATGAAHVGVYDGPAVNDTLKQSTVRNQVLNIPFDRNTYSLFQAPSHGLLDLSNSSLVLYTPNSNYTGFDSFVLVDTTQSPHAYFTVQMRILQYTPPNKMAFDDVVYTPVDQAISFNVRGNDVGNLTVKSWQTPANFPGNLSGKTPGGNVTFTPNSAYSGIARFFYSLGNLFVANVETGTANVVIDNLAPELDKYTLTTQKNSPFIINYPVPFTDFDFEVLIEPSHGDVEYFPGFTTYSANGQSVSGYNMLVYSPDPGFVGSDWMEILYCINSNGQCRSTKVFFDVVQPNGNPNCIEDCVWPGDVNLDGVVSNTDILPLGYYIGMEGPSRPNANIDWIAHKSTNWDNEYSALKYDIKHLDTDGNGEVETLDTLAISQHYHNRDQVTPDFPVTSKGLPFSLEISPSNPGVGDYVEVEISLGSDSNQVTDLYGYTFDFQLSPIVVDSALKMEFYSDSWTTRNAPYLSFWKKPAPGRLETAFTRTNGNIAHGGGLIGEASFIIIDIIDITKPDELPTLQITVQNPANMWGNGQMSAGATQVFEFPLDAGSGDDRSTTILSKPDDLFAFPNPATETITFHLNGKDFIRSIQVYDLSGRFISETKGLHAESHTLSLESMEAGLYLARVQTGSGMLVKKFQVSRL